MIIEGTSRDMVSLCMNDAEIIVYMSFQSFYTIILYYKKSNTKERKIFTIFRFVLYNGIEKYKIGKSIKEDSL